MKIARQQLMMLEIAKICLDLQVFTGQTAWAAIVNQVSRFQLEKIRFYQHELIL